MNFIKKRKKITIIIGLISLFLFVGAEAMALEYVQPGEVSEACNSKIRDLGGPGNIEKGIMNAVSDRCYACGECTLCDLLSVGVSFANFIMSVIGALVLGMFIWGAFDLVTSAGSSEKIQKGKKRMIDAVTGLIVVLLAWQIVNAVLFSMVGDSESGLLNTWSNVGQLCQKNWIENVGQ